MRPLKIAVAAFTLCAATVLAQSDIQSRIKPLEDAMSSGQASRAQQMELARLYMQSGRYYEATKIADRMLADDPNDAAAKELRAGAARSLRDVQDKNVAAAQARAKSGTDADRMALANAYFDAGSYG